MQEPARLRKVVAGVGFSKHVIQSQQQVDIRSQDQWSCVTDHGKLHTTLHDKPRARCVLDSRCKVIFRRFTTGYGSTVKTACSAMHKCVLEYQKQLATRFFVFTRQQDVFEIGIQSLFVAHAKAAAFGAENSFGISAKNKPAACL